jgi:hypothetical protein
MSRSAPRAGGLAVMLSEGGVGRLAPRPAFGIAVPGCDHSLVAGLPDPGPAFGLLRRRRLRHRYRPASQFGERYRLAATPLV